MPPTHRWHVATPTPTSPDRGQNATMENVMPGRRSQRCWPTDAAQYQHAALPGSNHRCNAPTPPTATADNRSRANSRGTMLDAGWASFHLIIAWQFTSSLSRVTQTPASLRRLLRRGSGTVVPHACGTSSVRHPPRVGQRVAARSSALWGAPHGLLDPRTRRRDAAR